MTTQPPARIWLASGGRISGPYELGELLEMAGDGRLGDHCQVRFEGQQGWLSYGAWKSGMESRGEILRQGGERQKTNRRW